MQKVEGRQFLGVYRPSSAEGGRFDLYDLTTPRLSGGERALTAPTRTLHLPWGKSGAHAAEVHAILVDEQYRNSLVLTRGLGARAREHTLHVVANAAAAQPAGRGADAEEGAMGEFSFTVTFHANRAHNLTRSP